MKKTTKKLIKINQPKQKLYENQTSHFALFMFNYLLL